MVENQIVTNHVGHGINGITGKIAREGAVYRVPTVAALCRSQQCTTLVCWGMVMLLHTQLHQLTHGICVKVCSTCLAA